MPYQVYDAGVNTGTTYLTEKVAYFLGGIYAANETVMAENNRYWAAPVRYNPQYSSLAEIAEHFDYVSAISANVNGYTVMRDNIKGTNLDSGKNRLLGFSTFFVATTLVSLEAEIPNLRNALFASHRDVQKAFIIGVIDGRGTPDVSVQNGSLRYLSLDCPNNEIGDFLSEVFINYGIDVNYNTARDRLEGGNPRKPQLRVKDVEWYMANMGYISPAKFRKLSEVYTNKFGRANVTNDDGFLMGLKYLRG